mgnify:CR=1 FL=1
MSIRKLDLFIAVLVVSVFVGQIVWLISPAYAQNAELDQLQRDIQDRGGRLADIEKEIAKYEAELQVVGAERRTLQNAINQLELERRKIRAEISRTETLISSTDLEINKLILEISRTEREIDSNQSAVADLIRAQYQASNESLIEILLQNRRLSDFWKFYEAQESIRNTLTNKVAGLSELQALLLAKRNETTAKRSSLESLRNQFTDQNFVLANNQTEQAKLLEVTRNEERNYQQLLAQQQQARDQIIKELREFESRLQFILDPNTIPAPGTRVFDWPLNKIIVTQYFGGSEFARRNPGVYGGRAYHPGVDFGAPRGTPIHAPLGGVVRDTGNTDLIPGCFSWGKWILLDHANGLSTLYAHLDVISVQPGQRVATGEIIGYTGNTGFSTGPHLHFTVYVKDGVSVRQFNEIRTVTSCGPAKTPVAATEAYIDPMLYLPPL